MLDLRATLLFLLAIIQFSDAVCPPGTTNYKDVDRCYEYVRSQSSFSDAEQYCFYKFGHLASVSNVNENTVVTVNATMNFIGIATEFWLGGTTAQVAQWTWTNHKAWGYQNFTIGQGSNISNLCLASTVKIGDWLSKPCSYLKPFVCSLPAQPCPPRSKKTLKVGKSPVKRIVAETQNDQGACDKNWSQLNDNCYYSYCNDTFRTKWQEAEDECVKLGSNLVSIHSEEENMFVNGLTGANFAFSNFYQTWTGLSRNSTSDQCKGWKWSDKSPVDYLTWAPGEPNNKGNEYCVETYSDIASGDFYNLYKWNDMSCNIANRCYVCKKPIS